MHALRLAVVGDPVEHSRSPELFRIFMRAENRVGSYDAVRICAGDGARDFDALRSRGYVGLNVTTPLKEEAFGYATTRDAVAEAARAVNLLLLGEQTRGYNTDGAGAIGALAGAGFLDLAERRILILGAGPTARAALVALATAGARVALWNRTHAHAMHLAAIHAIDHFDASVTYDAILSTLSPGARPEDLGAPISTAIENARHVIDANYGERATLAKHFARTVHDGREMLEASARASYEIFTRSAIG